MFRGHTSENDPENKLRSQGLQNYCDKYVIIGKKRDKAGCKVGALQ